MRPHFSPVSGPHRRYRDTGFLQVPYADTAYERLAIPHAKILGSKLCCSASHLTTMAPIIGMEEESGKIDAGTSGAGPGKGAENGHLSQFSILAE
jgi:hypothetical protein